MVKDQSQNAREDYVNEDNVNLLILISITLYPVTTQTHYLSKKSETHRSKVNFNK